MPPPPRAAALAPTAMERAWRRLVPPRAETSAGAIYALMPRQRGGQLPLVDVPYAPRSEEHWAEAARIADYVAHLPPAAGDGARAPVVLDIGPGDGWPSLPIAAERPDVRVVGVDPAAERCRVSAANARRMGLPHAAFVRGDAARLPVADGSCDLVVAASALEEAAEPEAAFRDIRRALRPGGVLRASYQDWVLPTDGWEAVLAWDGVAPGDPAATAEWRRPPRAGERLLLYTYIRRVADPPVERRYTLVLPDRPPAAALHAALLPEIARAPRAYGETVLTGALGEPALRSLAPHAVDSTVVELRRWTTEWLAAELQAAGFSTVRTTAHPGELGRRFARELGRRDALGPLLPHFAEAAGALGRLAGDIPGRQMVTAVR